MNINVRGNKIIKNQNIELKQEVTIIYGYNNCGKTTILKEIEVALVNKVKENFYKPNSLLSLYIPTNRVIVSTSKVDLPLISDIEELVNYKLELHKGYDQHLKILREYLLKIPAIIRLLEEVIQNLFGIELPLNEMLYNSRYSDGIENILNIYLNIIWILTWDINLEDIEYSDLKKILSINEAIILIDEIEMYLHVNIQSKLIDIIKSDFNSCRFILTTHSPLLLTRYANSEIYKIEDGELDLIDKKLFYQDLDKTFDVYFDVDSIPLEINDAINYLGKIITGRVQADIYEVNKIDEKLEREFPNIHIKYNSLIAKAKYMGENHD